MGELKGLQWQARDLAKLLYDGGWKEPVNLVTMLAVLLSESQGYQGAVNDNLDAAGAIKSRDCGLLQINIPASKIGTDEEQRLFDDPEYNVARGRALYTTKTATGIRGFQPWYGYTKHVYLRDTYVKRASRGVGNFLAAQLLERTPTDILNDGQPYVHKLTNPVLDYQYRVVEMAVAHRAILAKARQLKPIGGPLVDAKADEIIRLAVDGAEWPKT